MLMCRWLSNPYILSRGVDTGLHYIDNIGNLKYVLEPDEKPGSRCKSTKLYF